MNGKSYTITTTGGKFYPKQEFQESDLEISAEGTDLYYTINTDSAVRTAQTIYDTTGADDSAKTYTVADETIYRVGETLQVLDSLDAYKGHSKIVATATGEITVEPFADYTLESGDKLVVESDPKLPDGKIYPLRSKGISFMTLKAAATTSTQNFNVIVIENIEKKN